MSNRVVIMTQTSKFERVFSSDVLASTALTVTDLAAEPSETDAGWINMGQSGFVPNTAILAPYGKAALGTFTVYVWGVDAVCARNSTPGSSPTQWHPILLSKFTVTLGNASNLLGVAGGIPDNTYYYADTLADPPAGAGTIGSDTRSHALSGQQGFYQIDTTGCQWLKFGIALGTATTANLLLRSL